MSQPLSPELRKHLTRLHEFWLVLLRAGPSRDQSDEAAGEIQRGHLEHLFSLRASGVLVLSGPVLEPDSPLRGICIFACDDRSEVEGYLRDDPAVLSGRLVFEILRWGGIAGDALPGLEAPD